MTRTGLGERDIIRRLTKRLGQTSSKLPLGYDDDVSAYPISSRKWLISKIDTLVGSTDVPPGMTLEQASRKAVVATVSDFAGKGVRPSGLLVSLLLKPPVTSRMVDEIGRGILRAEHEYNIRVIGGDTGEAKDLVIDCAGFGLADSQRLLRRNGARVGDIIAVTGPFGKTSGGLRILLSRRKNLGARFPGLVRAVIHPVARLDIGLKLANSGVVNSSMDSSDGLAWTLHEVARLSHVSMVLEKTPVAKEAVDYALMKKLDPEELGLHGGEEYELVVTIQRDKFDKLKRKIPSLIRIGTVERGDGEVFLRSRGELRRIEPRGWEHMISR